MTKIKNFRISLRPREMARWLKRERGMETTPELELALEQAAKDAKSRLETAALYTTLTRQIAEKTTPLSFTGKSIAVSVVAVSIGSLLETERLNAQTDPIQESLLAALEQEALAQSLQFVVRLVQDQAKEEDCEMSSPVLVEDPQAASTLATLLGVQRIGVVLDASVPIMPPQMRLATLFWTPIGKGSNRRSEPASASATGKPGGRAEKVPV